MVESPAAEPSGSLRGRSLVGATAYVVSDYPRPFEAGLGLCQNRLNRSDLNHQLATQILARQGDFSKTQHLCCLFSAVTVLS